MAKQRHMTADEQKEYDQLTEKAKQIELRLDELLYKPVRYGYVRVSSKGQAKDGNSLEAQEKTVRDAGAEYVFKDVYTGTTTKRPELDKLLELMRPGDTLIITKLDRIARSVQQGIELIDGLVKKGIRVHVLNLGVMDDTPTGKLIRNVMLCFAEFERDMIMQRTREGKEIARTKEGYREGRKPKYSEEQLKHALDLLKEQSYSQVVKMTGISKRTLIRAKHRYEEENSDSGC